MERYTEDQLYNLEVADFENNDEVDNACIERLFCLCDEFGDDGADARELLNIVKRKLQIET